MAISYFLCLFFLSAFVSCAIQFEKQVIDPSLFGDYYVKPFDVDQDGYVDIVAIAYGSGKLVWYRNPHQKGLPWNQSVIAEVLQYTKFLLS